MELSDLKIFLAVARQQSISRAAEELHYVQSNVTARIKQLEAGLGATLFHRKSKGVALTAAGQLLHDYALRILSLAKEAEDAIAEGGEPQGRLLIGSMETTAAIRLPQLLAAYHRAYPRVDLNLITGPSAESLGRLRAFEVDAALVAGEMTDAALMAEKAFEEELVLVAPLGVQAPLQLDEPKILVFRSGCSYRAQLEKWIEQRGRRPNRIMEFGSIEGILGCIAAGMGISLLPRSVVDRPQHRNNCAIHPLPPEVGHVTTWLVRRRDEQPSKALQAFREMILAN